MKKILIVDIGKEKGGIEKYIYNIYSHIDKSAFQIDFLVFNESCAYEEEFSENSQVFHVISRRDNYFQHIQQVNLFFKTHCYDTVWIQTCSASNIVSHRAVKKNTNAKLITHAHVVHAEPKGLLKDLITDILHRINRPILRKITDEALACSEEAGRYLFGNKQKVNVVYNGIQLSDYSTSANKTKELKEQFGIKECETVLGHVGRFSKVKNHRFIIDVFKKYLTFNSNSKLILIGDGEQKIVIEELVNSYGLQNKVIFTGERRDVPALYSLMDVFLLPSFNEGFGIVAIEAQASNVTTIINENLSETLEVSNFLYKLPINKGAELWAEEICKLINISGKAKKWCDTIYKFDVFYTTKYIESIL